MKKPKPKSPPPPMTDREVIQVALSMIRIEKKRFNLPDHYKVWLNQREADLTAQLTKQQNLL